MLVRALVVLLLVLNLGVAAWWTLRAPPAPAPAFVQPPGVATLALVSERKSLQPAAAPKAIAPVAPAHVATATTAAPVPASTPPAPIATPAPSVASAPPARCYSVGPFADSAAAGNAREVLMVVASRVVPREQRSGSARGWRVYLPPMTTLAEAQAAAQRITAAGFSDYFIVRQGSEANSIALGRYRSEDTARRRADSLAAAGFAVRAEPLGDGGPSNVWLDLVAKPEFDPARAEAAVQVPARVLDCARMR